MLSAQLLAKGSDETGSQRNIGVEQQQQRAMQIRPRLVLRPDLANPTRRQGPAGNHAHRREAGAARDFGSGIAGLIVDYHNVESRALLGEARQCLRKGVRLVAGGDQYRDVIKAFPGAPRVGLQMLNRAPWAPGQDEHREPGDQRKRRPGEQHQATRSGLSWEAFGVLSSTD